MSYHPIGQLDMSRGLRPSSPGMSYATQARASASPPSQGMTYATTARGSAPAPSRPGLVAMTMRSVGALPSLLPMMPKANVLTPTGTAMSFADERGRLQALQVLARPYAVALAEAMRAPGLSITDRARLAEMSKVARQLSAAVSSVSPHARGWVRADIERLKAVVPLLPQPADMELLARAGQSSAVGYARRILQAWGELFGSLRAGGWWTAEAPPPMTLRTGVRTSAPVPMQRASVPGYQATDTVAPVEEPLAPEVTQPQDATQPMPDRPECLRVPAPPDCFPGSFPGPGTPESLLPEERRGIPWWVWLLGAGVAGGGLYLATRKR